MDPKIQSSYKQLVSLQGLVLSWVGYDAEEDRFLLLLANNAALSIPSGELTLLPDASSVLKASLAEHKLHASQILALENTLKQRAYMRGYTCGVENMLASDTEFETQELLDMYKQGLAAGTHTRKVKEEADLAAKQLILEMETSGEPGNPPVS